MENMERCVVCQELWPICCDDDGEPMCFDCCHALRLHINWRPQDGVGGFEVNTL
jgi:hypothetical protein